MQEKIITLKELIDKIDNLSTSDSSRASALATSYYISGYKVIQSDEDSRNGEISCLVFKEITTPNGPKDLPVFHYELIYNDTIAREAGLSLKTVLPLILKDVAHQLSKPAAPDHGLSNQLKKLFPKETIRPDLS